MKRPKSIVLSKLCTFILFSDSKNCTWEVRRMPSGASVIISLWRAVGKASRSKLNRLRLPKKNGHSERRSLFRRRPLSTRLTDYFFPANEFANSSQQLRIRVFVKCSKPHWTISNAASVICITTDESVRLTAVRFLERIPGQYPAKRAIRRHPQGPKTFGCTV